LHVSTYTNNYTLCPFPFSYDIWHHILGEFNPQFKSVQDTKEQSDVMGRRSGESCRNLLIELKILPLKLQYILSLLLFMTNNKHYLTTNSENCSICTRRNNDLRLPQTNLPIYEKEVYYSDVTIFNNLPADIKDTSGNLKRFKKFKTFLITHSFYSL
jgi:hypothetical protein